MRAALSALLGAPALLLMLAACSAEPDPAAPIAATPEDSAPAPAPAAPAPTAPIDAAWDLVSSGEGDGLSLVARDDTRLVTLFCPAGDPRLLVNVPAFTPVASEERMSLGAGLTVVTLVADPAGDPLRGGVSGAGPVPAELPAILAAPDGIAVNYGAQNVGPFPPLRPELADLFLAACSD